MLLIAVMMLVQSSMQEDELLRVSVYPGSWAAALSKVEHKPVSKRDIRAVGCVGLDAKDMFCGWERRAKGQWREFTGRADLRADVPIISTL